MSQIYAKVRELTKLAAAGILKPGFRVFFNEFSVMVTIMLSDRLFRA
ncbi:MAG: hypothetical protein ABL925_17395 [Methylococcales bacterium]